MKKQLLSLLLCLCLVLSLLPGTALAAEEGHDTPQEGDKVSVTIGNETKYYATFNDAWYAATNENANTNNGDPAITLLESVTEKNGSAFNLSNGHNIQVTVNIPKGMTLTLDRGFFVNPGDQSLTINGAPEGSGSGNENGKLVVGDFDSEPGAVRTGSGLSGSQTPSTVTIKSCDINAANGPAVFGGDANVVITDCNISATPKATDLNRTAAVSIAPNQGVDITLMITGSTLTGRSGLWIGAGVTATVLDSTICGTGTGTSDYGASVYGGELTVGQGTTIESPIEGAHIYGGKLDLLEGGVIKATGDSGNMMITGVTIGNNSSDTSLAAPEAVIGGTIQSTKYGVRVADEKATATIQGSASVSGGSDGVFLEKGKVTLISGSIRATGVENGNSTYGAGICVLGGTAEITGTAQITGVSHGILINGTAAKVINTGSGAITATGASGYGITVEQGTLTTSSGVIQAQGENGTGLCVTGGSVTVTGGTIRATGGGENSSMGLGVFGGSVALKGGSYQASGEVGVAVLASDSVTALLAPGFAYYKGDTILLNKDLEYGMREKDVSVKAGDPTGGGSDTPAELRVTRILGGSFGLRWEYPAGFDVSRAANVRVTFGSLDEGGTFLTDNSAEPDIGTFSSGDNGQGGTAYHYVMNDPERATVLTAGRYKGAVEVFDGEDKLIISGDLDFAVSALTRGDMASLLYTYGRPQAEPAELPGDCTSLDANYQTSVRAVLGAEWMPLTADGTFSPDGIVTFGQLAGFICRANGWEIPEDKTPLEVLAEHEVIHSAELIEANDVATDVRVEDWMLAAFRDKLPAISDIRYDYSTGALSWTGRNIPETRPGQYFWVETYTSQGVFVEGSGRECMETDVHGSGISVTKNGDTYSCVYKPVALGDGQYAIVITGRFPNGLVSKQFFTVATAPSGGNTPSGGGTSSGGSSSYDDDDDDDSSSGSSGIFGSSGSGGSSGSSGSTTKNNDGSTTTRTENKSTGTVTETTKNPDGSQTKVETKKDGTVTTTETDKAGNKSETVAKPDGTTVTKVARKDGTTATVTTNASGKTEAAVKLPAEAVSEARQEAKAVALPIPEVRASRDTGSAPAVTVSTGSKEPVKVEIPLSNTTPGTVAVLVKADGTEEVIKTSVPTEKGVAVALPDGATVKLVDKSKDFADVPADSWAADAVRFSSARELFGGTSETTFSPNAPMTRAMMVTVLARFDGENTSGGGTWYQKGVDWAVAKGISDGSNPYGNVTREQLVTMLWRYSGAPAASGTLGGFADSAQVSGYARDAMCWAIENGIINGYGNGQLGPQKNATRAQTAQILKNFIEK